MLDPTSSARPFYLLVMLLLVFTACTGSIGSDDSDADADTEFAADFSLPPDQADEPELANTDVQEVGVPDQDTTEEPAPDIVDTGVVEIEECPADTALTLDLPAAGSCTPLSSEDALSWVNTNLRSHFVGLADSVQFFEDNPLVDSVVTELEIDFCGESTGEGDGDGGEDCQPGFQIARLQDLAVDASDWFAEETVIADNLEASDNECVVVLRVPPTQLCSSKTSSEVRPTVDGETGDFPVGDTGRRDMRLDTGYQVDAGGNERDCIWDSIPVRIAMWSPSDGDIYAELLVGDEEANPVDARVFAGQLSVIVDAPEVLEAARIIALNSEGSADLPERVLGLVEADITLLSAGAYDFTINVRDELDLAWTYQDVFFDDSHVRPLLSVFSQACPAVRVMTDSENEVLSLIMRLQPLFASVPLEMLKNECKKGDGYSGCRCFDDMDEVIECEDLGAISIDTEGITLSATLGKEAPELMIEGFGSPEVTTVAFNETPIATLDINADQGRAFDLSVTATNHTWTGVFTPEVHVVGNLDFDDVESFAEDAPEWTHEEVMEVVFEEADTPTFDMVFLSGPEESGPSHGFVSSGRLDLVSSFLDRTVRVTEGECFRPDDSGGEGGEGDDGPGHPFESIKVSDCTDL